MQAEIPADAQRMLDLFASVSATHFAVTLKNLAGEKEWFRRSLPMIELRRTLPRMLAESTSKQRSVIVRPYGLATSFIQLDDLSATPLERVRSVAFLALETSPGNHQAWLAVPGDDDREFQQRVRRGAGADVGATGATRIAGSLNFKPKYAPDFPRVTMIYEQPGRTTTPDVLQAMGLVAAPDVELPPFQHAPPVFPPTPAKPGRDKKWPSYAICLERAPPNRDKSGPSRSHADLSFCMISITWGFSVAETAHQLMQQDESKATQRTKEYALATARKAARYVDQRKGRQPRF